MSVNLEPENELIGTSLLIIGPRLIGGVAHQLLVQLGGEIVGE